MDKGNHVNMDDSEAATSKALCNRCLFPNEPEAPFCEKCGARLASAAPFESVRAECELFRRAIERPGRLVVILGMWLIFAPCVLVGALLVRMGFGAGGFSLSFSEVAGILLGAGVLGISSTVLFKTTRNYLRGRGKNR